MRPSLPARCLRLAGLGLAVALVLLTAGPAASTIVVGRETGAGQVILSMNNLGYFGSLLNPVVSWASCEYPSHSHVEHLFVAGLWVGARPPEGDVHVSAGADDWLLSQPEPEYGPRFQDGILELSNDPLSPRYSTRALAQEQFEMSYDDYNAAGGGSPAEPHVPLGIRVHATVLAYDEVNADDFIVLDFVLENISGGPLNDVYVGWYSEFTVGNTTVTFPGGQPGWNFYDDVSGLFAPGDVQGDPDIRMMYAYDADAEGGAAPSWIGTRLLGTALPFSTFTYRQWRWHGTGWPQNDAEKYETMASGQMDVGSEFETTGDWVSMFSVGPWPMLSDGATARFTIAIVAGLGRDHLLRNSRSALETYEHGFVPVPVSSASFGELKARF